MHYLVAARCNVNLPRHDGATPLFCAVRSAENGTGCQFLGTWGGFPGGFPLKPPRKSALKTGHPQIQVNWVVLEKQPEMRVKGPVDHVILFFSSIYLVTSPLKNLVLKPHVLGVFFLGDPKKVLVFLLSQEPTKQVVPTPKRDELPFSTFQVTVCKHFSERGGCSSLGAKAVATLKVPVAPAQKKSRRTGNFPPVHLLLEAAADVDRFAVLPICQGLLCHVVVVCFFGGRWGGSGRGRGEGEGVLLGCFQKCGFVLPQKA